MTLVGLLPPLCEGGNMLVDGGYCELGHYSSNTSLRPDIFNVEWTTFRYEQPFRYRAPQLTIPAGIDHDVHGS